MSVTLAISKSISNITFNDIISIPIKYSKLSETNRSLIKFVK